MNEKLNLDKKFGVFTPKLWYLDIFGSKTAAKDENEELEFLEDEYFQLWNDVEQAFGGCTPIGMHPTNDELEGDEGDLENPDGSGNTAEFAEFTDEEPISSDEEEGEDHSYNIVGRSRVIGVQLLRGQEVTLPQTTGGDEEEDYQSDDSAVNVEMEEDNQVSHLI